MNGSPQRSTVSTQTTPTTLPSILVPMKLPKIVLDKTSDDPLEWLEWSGQFIATIEQSGTADSVKTNYSKTLVIGKTKAAIEGMGYFVQFYHVAWQTLEHDT